MRTRREEIIEQQRIETIFENLKIFEKNKCNCELCRYLRDVGFFKND